MVVPLLGTLYSRQEVREMVNGKGMCLLNLFLIREAIAFWKPHPIKFYFCIVDQRRSYVHSWLRGVHMMSIFTWTPCMPHRIGV